MKLGERSARLHWYEHNSPLFTYLVHERKPPSVSKERVSYSALGCCPSLRLEREQRRTPAQDRTKTLLREPTFHGRPSYRRSFADCGPQIQLAYRGRKERKKNKNDIDSKYSFFPGGGGGFVKIQTAPFRETIDARTFPSARAHVRMLRPGDAAIARTARRLNSCQLSLPHLKEDISRHEHV